MTVAAGATRTVDKSVDWDVSFAETITVTSVSRRDERIIEAPAAVTVVTEQEIEREAATGPGAEAARVHARRRLHPERPLRLQLQHPRLQQLAEPPHPDADRRPRPGGAVPGLPGVGRGLLPAGRARQRRAGARPRLRALRRQRLQRRPQHDDQVAARQRGGQAPPHRRRARAPLRADFRWAAGFGAGFYGKVVGGYQESDDFTRSRNTSVEYYPFCATPGDTNCLRREAVPLALDEVKIGFGGLRLDKYFDEPGVLTLEGGTAQPRGPDLPDRHRPRPGHRRQAPLGAGQLQHPALERPRLLRPAQGRGPARPGLGRPALRGLLEPPRRDPGQRRLRRRPGLPGRRRRLPRAGGRHRPTAPGVQTLMAEARRTRTSRRPSARSSTASPTG